jgi:general secretion pathway protein D
LFSEWGRGLRPFAAALALAGLAACAPQQIRDDADQLLRAGQYEPAVQRLEEGLRQHPDSPVLRSGLLRARGEATARLVAEAAAARGTGRLDEAATILRRAKALDARNERLDALLAELDTERRQRAALLEAEQLVGKRQPVAALKVVTQALKDNPRHADLLNLQRRLEIDARQAEVNASVSALSETRPISLDFRDAGLRAVLDVVSRNSGINFVLDKDIRPDTRTTVYLRSAKVEDAIDLIVSTNQLAKKVIDAKTVLIYPNTPEKQKEHQEQVVKVFYLASADAKSTAAFLKSMLKVREPFVDERSNIIAIREAPETVQLAERLVALYDTNDPEVLLEVEVMEVRATRLTELGVKLPQSFSLTLLPPAGATGLTVAGLEHVSRDRVGVTAPSATINLRREVGDFNTLANPRIRARNKEKAKVLIGDKLPIVTATQGTGGFVSDSVTYLDVGLKLEVEPTVYADDEVAIKVALEVSSLSREIRTPSGSLAYQIGTRNASTLLRLRDGETQLLAGLISKEDRTSASRVPLAGDLPVLGRLFSNQLDDAQRTELVLAITPRIIRNIRRPDANETELWVGTEAMTKLRPVGGLRASASEAAPASVSAEPQRGGPAIDAAAAAEAKPALRLSGPAEAKAGDVVAVQLSLESAAALRGMPLQFAYTRQRLSLLGADEGDYFKRDGAQTNFSSSGEAGDGRLRVGVLRTQATGASGQGPVVTLRFKALEPGPAEVVLLSAEPIGITQPALAPTLPPALHVEVK